jgi:hypothetical protein
MSAIRWVSEAKEILYDILPCSINEGVAEVGSRLSWRATQVGSISKIPSRSSAAKNAIRKLIEGKSIERKGDQLLPKNDSKGRRGEALVRMLKERGSCIQRDLQSESGLTIGTVRDIRRAMKKAGWITIEGRGDKAVWTWTGSLNAHRHQIDVRSMR